MAGYDTVSGRATYNAAFDPCNLISKDNLRGRILERGPREW